MKLERYVGALTFYKLFLIALIQQERKTFHSLPLLSQRRRSEWQEVGNSWQNNETLNQLILYVNLSAFRFDFLS